MELPDDVEVPDEVELDCEDREMLPLKDDMLPEPIEDVLVEPTIEAPTVPDTVRLFSP